LRHPEALPLGGSTDWQATDLNALVEEALNLAYQGARSQDQNFDLTLERDFDRDLALVDVVPQEVTRDRQWLLCGQPAEPRGVWHISPCAEGHDPGARRNVEIRVRDNGRKTGTNFSNLSSRPSRPAKAPGLGCRSATRS
jgi:hypothetical protein